MGVPPDAATAFDSYRRSMSTQHIETLIIGAGQAGLATGQQLQQRGGRPFLIVDGNDRIGDNWRQQWDSLRLYSPARYDGLPGLAFPGKPGHYPGKDEVADYLEQYALHFDLPVRMSTRVDRLEAAEGPQGRFRAVIGLDSLTCDNVVVATGTFGRTPFVPPFAADLDPGIQQLHSSAYRRAAQVAPGKVLVVGGSHSGMDVAHELAASHEVVLCGRRCGEVPITLESRRGLASLRVIMFVFQHVLTRRTSVGRRKMDEVRRHGGPSLRVKQRDLDARHVERITERVTGVSGGRPLLADGRVVDATAIVWCTGFRQAFAWIDVPVFQDDGWPEEYRGVVEGAPGLYFCGLSFQYAFSSMLILGAGRDARYVAKQIAAHSVRTPAGRATHSTAA